MIFDHPHNAAIRATYADAHGNRAGVVEDGIMRDGPLEGEELSRLRSAELTYPEACRTRDAMPSGYHQLYRRVRIGSGRDRFEQASRTLLLWQMHRRAGVRVRPSSQRVAPGAVAVLRLGAGFAAVRAPVKVVYVVDEGRRQGFAYGTLPGHPESGEESFVVELHDDDAVTLTVRAFSRPASLPARVAGPVGRAVQGWITGRYVRALQD